MAGLTAVTGLAAETGLGLPGLACWAGVGAKPAGLAPGELVPVLLLVLLLFGA